MSALIVNQEMSYNELKRLLGVTDGNLASHLKSLEKMRYIEYQKSFVGRKPQTTYQSTKLGRMAFEKHLEALEKLLNK